MDISNLTALAAAFLGKALVAVSILLPIPVASALCEAFGCWGIGPEGYEFGKDRGFAGNALLALLALAAALGTSLAVALLGMLLVTVCR